MAALKPAPFEDKWEQLTLSNLSNGEAEADFQAFLEEANGKMYSDPDAFEAKGGRVQFKANLQVTLQYDKETGIAFITHSLKRSFPNREPCTVAATVTPEGITVKRQEFTPPLQIAGQDRSK